ncbi:MAG: amidohydrolase [Acidimicrobiales bacterium]
MHPATDARGVLYRGGPIVTVDPGRARAEAVATRAGQIVAVGNEDDCRRAIGLPVPASADGSSTDQLGDGPSVVDLDGRALLPGFVDGHLHPMAMCFYAGRPDLRGARSVADVLDALADHARETPPGEWVVGLQLTPDRLEEHRWPTLAELDGVSTGQAVVVVCHDGRTSIGNSAALGAAGIRSSRPDPPGGAFGRDAQGRLDGVCWETATRLLLSNVTLPDLDQLKAKMSHVFAQLAVDGITSASFVMQTDDEGPAGAAGALESVGMMIFIDDLALGAHSLLGGDPARAVDARASSTLHNPGLNHVVGGVKLYLDGTLDARTAYLHAPYTDEPSRRGWLTLDREVAVERMEAIHLAGLQICLQAIGDAANALALDLFAELARRHPPSPGTGPRHRITQASLLDQEAADRFAELGLSAVVQPPILRSQASWLCSRLGVERASRAYPFRSLADAGVVLAGSSNAPVEGTDVLAGIAAAVTRSGFEPAQGLSPTEAVGMYTRGGAIAQQREHVTGRVAEGLHADLVVLSHDPTAVPPDVIADIDVLLTMARGHVVHRAEGWSARPAAR